ncbi:MAG: hyaluronidase [Gammaproteobacteria bacterium]|nr:MAG: hyaluronidase [Gammaproteobacteria bacterium]RLA61755.1 MAG: hyaluronidase [Gammaproteobacteria bacterium]
MSASTEFLSGIIEGFYGRPWSFDTRRAYAGFLAQAGLNTCIYCPKADPFLRKRWQDHWPRPQWQHLLQLSSAYRERGIKWGVGLSPFELYRHYGPVERQQLRRKLDMLMQLEAPLLAILFDDMPGDLDALAARQAEIVADVCHWAPGVRVLVCPTYYSFDPVLERFFGRMPAGYWPQLGRELPGAVDIFWTGNQVCSGAIAIGDIEAINQQLGRQVMLWDNYPVNDGATRSNFLYCSKLSRRDPASRQLLAGHLCNPMNQGILSLPAIAGLAELYGGPALDEEWLQQVLGPLTWEQLQRHREAFEHKGLSGMGDQRCRELASRYAALPGAAAGEVAGWLRGVYTFDPACLTD